MDYFIVDVFTDTALKGNPLAVVMDSAGLATERMQAIAREFNLSETTFVQRGALEQERREGVRVRIFTTQEELNFAGHPTLGTASVLRLFAPEAVEGGTVKLKLNAGAKSPSPSAAFASKSILERKSANCTILTEASLRRLACFWMTRNTFLAM